MFHKIIVPFFLEFTNFFCLFYKKKKKNPLRKRLRNNVRKCIQLNLLLIEVLHIYWEKVKLSLLKPGNHSRYIGDMHIVMSGLFRLALTLKELKVKFGICTTIMIMISKYGRKYISVHFFYIYIFWKRLNIKKKN